MIKRQESMIWLYYCEHDSRLWSVKGWQLLCFGTIQRDLVALLHRLAAGSNETVNTCKYGGKGPAEHWNRLDIDCLDRYN
jgi:hypothetical protein